MTLQQIKQRFQKFLAFCDDNLWTINGIAGAILGAALLYSDPTTFAVGAVIILFGLAVAAAFTWICNSPESIRKLPVFSAVPDETTPVAEAEATEELPEIPEVSTTEA